MCPVYGKPVSSGNRGFNPRKLKSEAFIIKNIENTPEHMEVRVRVYSKQIIVSYFDCVGNCYIFSFYKTNKKYKIHSTFSVSTKDGLIIDKMPGYMLTSINTCGLNEDDAVEAVARFCAGFEIDRLVHVQALKSIGFEIVKR